MQQWASSFAFSHGSFEILRFTNEPYSALPISTYKPISVAIYILFIIRYSHLQMNENELQTVISHVIFK